MKKIIALILAVVMIGSVALVGCSTENEEGTQLGTVTEAQ